MYSSPDWFRMVNLNCHYLWISNKSTLFILKSAYDYSGTYVTHSSHPELHLHQQDRCSCSFWKYKALSYFWVMIRQEVWDAYFSVTVSYKIWILLQCQFGVRISVRSLESLIELITFFVKLNAGLWLTIFFRKLDFRVCACVCVCASVISYGSWHSHTQGTTFS